MKQILPTLFIYAFFLPAFAQQRYPSENKGISGFTENKGQVCDQHQAARPDVLFSGNSGNFIYHLRRSGISYQLSKVEEWKTEKDQRLIIEQLVPKSTSIYRLDMEWPGANPNAEIRTDKALPGYSNYFLSVCPDGVYNVKTYTGIVYNNIYKNIDLHYYLDNGQLKYDYLVAPHGNYHQIKIRIKGAEKILIQPDGSLLIKTPAGSISEAAPMVFQGQNKIPSKWVVKGNELSFSISRYDPRLPLVIDPLVRTWGTYYGGAANDEGRDCATDGSGNVYLVGRSNSGTAIATSGSFKTVLSGSSYDAYIAKFNNAGVRLWATYYGGAGDDKAYSCATDASGNVYVTGEAGYNSTTGISTAGAQQVFMGGGFNSDAFLVKFNSSGARLWGTYYGGSGTDLGEGVAVDPATQDVYMCGFSGASAAINVITTTGAHQTSFGAAFLAKFNSTGTRLWGTYYGNSAWSHAIGLAVDPSGNVIIGGNSDATADIASPGALQSTCLGMMDAYIAKFTSAGVRLWGTFYGEISMDSFWSICTDAAGNIYAGGSSGSPTGIATPGAHQTVIGMAYNPDGMLVKFDGNGVRQWATYYGGSTEDVIYGCLISPAGDLYISGYSNSVNPGVIATPGSFQTVNGGYGDAFLARFTTGGVRLWGTFYGEALDDCGFSCASDANSNIYLAGKATAGTGNIFASPGCHQPVFGGSLVSYEGDGFLALFSDNCPVPAAPVNITPITSSTLCSGSAITLSATSTGTVTWYASAVSAQSLGSGTVFTSPVLNAGTVVYFAESSNACGNSTTRTPVTVTVYAKPTTTITGKVNVCKGVKSTFTASGASQYTWSNGSSGAVITFTPTSAVSFTVTGFSVNGCSTTASVTTTLFICTGLDEMAGGPEIKVFPNPTTGIITVSASGPRQVKITNAIGQTLMCKNIDQDHNKIDFGAYTSGIYFIEIKNENSRELVKIIKE
ncbi:MAG: SBBP repeat-containing protein [Bacteroidota bacterium]